MATDNLILRIKKLSGQNIVRKAAKHNLREIQAERGADSHIDASRIHLNTVMAGASTAEGVAAHAVSLMSEAKIKRKLRPDAVLALELLVSLPPLTTINQSAFFAEVLAWARDYYAFPVLSAVVHNDEDAVHCHILLLPLRDGCMRGSAAMGNVTRLHATYKDFYENVGRKYGLTRPEKPRRLNAATRTKAASLVLTTLQSDPLLMDKPEIEAALLTSFGNDPYPMLNALGLEVPRPQKKTRSFVEIMTQPVKPERRNEVIGRSAYETVASDSTEKEQTLSCVGFVPEKMSDLQLRHLHPTSGAQSQDMSHSSNDGTFSECVGEENAGEERVGHRSIRADGNTEEIRQSVLQGTQILPRLRTA